MKLVVGWTLLVSFLILLPIFFGYLILCFITFKPQLPYSGEPPEGISLTYEGPTDFENAVEVFSRCLQFETVAGNEEEFSEMKKFLKESFPLLHESLELVEFGRGLLYKWKGSVNSLEKKPLVLLSHMDVVPVPLENVEKWTHKNGFSGKVEDNYIFGRGAIDNKATLVGSMNAVEELLKSGFVPRRPVFLAFGLDEESGHEAYGAMNISKYLMDNEYEPVLIMDEGGAIVKDIFDSSLGITKKSALVGIAEKGYMSVNLSIDCEGGHGALPSSQPCIFQISKAVTNLMENPFKAYAAGEGSTTFQGFLNSLIPHSSSFFTRLFFSVAKNYNWMLDLLLSKSKVTNSMIRTVFAPTIIRGGKTENVLPKSAWVLISLRVHPMDSEDDIMRHLVKVINNKKISITKIGVFLNDKIADSRSVQFEVLAMCIQAVFDDVEIVIPNLLMAGTDLRKYKDLTPFTFNFAPIIIDGKTNDLERVHGVDERISVDNYIKLIQFFILFIQNCSVLDNFQK